MRSLLGVGTFALRPRTQIDAASLDRPIVWAHSSDLIDPTPWLEAGQLLLTDGAQFSRDVDAATVDGYCGRLMRLGVAGLGFATDVIHKEIPGVLVDACERHRIPLLEVAGGTPFISIIRHVADAVAADRSARLSWTLEAHRAVARAAVRDDGLREILRTLSDRLRTWVALYDSAGGRVNVSRLRALPGDLADIVDAEARMLLDRGVPAALRTHPPAVATLQTIGQRHRLRGVLAVGADVSLDPASNDLIGSVVALASIALEQQRAVDASRRRIRTGILELLLAGQTRAANRTAKAVWGSLPETPFLVGVIRGPVRGQSVLDELELLSATHHSTVFFAEHGDNVVITMQDSALKSLLPLIRRHGLTLGVSDETNWTALEWGIKKAMHAASTGGDHDVVMFADVAGKGVMGVLRSGGGEVVARHVLEPLFRLPASERDHLRASARAWLDANTAWDPAARALGIHRHTLRARIDQIGELLNLDLSEFSGRAQLWAAMDLADDYRIPLDDD
ncbi:PucR family transcriptional regulator [Okibacterium endophyticum]